MGSTSRDEGLVLGAILKRCVEIRHLHKLLVNDSQKCQTCRTVLRPSTEDAPHILMFR